MYVVLCACLYEPRYALGMTIYHLCVRKCPFALEFTQEDGVLYPGPSGVLQRTEVARAIIGGLRPACNWPSHEPNEWKKLMAKCWRQNPQGRASAHRAEKVFERTIPQSETTHPSVASRDDISPPLQFRRHFSLHA